MQLKTLNKMKKYKHKWNQDLICKIIQIKRPTPKREIFYCELIKQDPLLNNHFKVNSDIFYKEWQPITEENEKN